MNARARYQVRNPLGVSRKLRDVPVDRYRLPHDGRKWKVLARDRQSLAAWLATFADADGSRIYPAVSTMQEHFGWSHGKTYARLGDLEQLGLLESTQKLSGPHGTRVRKMNVEALVDLHDSRGLTSTIREQDSTIRGLASIPEMETTVTGPSPDRKPGAQPAPRPSPAEADREKEVRDRRKIEARDRREYLESMPRAKTTEVRIEAAVGAGPSDGRVIRHCAKCGHTSSWHMRSLEKNLRDDPRWEPHAFVSEESVGRVA